MEWDTSTLVGPDGADWRVPVSELEERQERLSIALAEAGLESAFIEDPVELYWLTGGRQNSAILIGLMALGYKRGTWSADRLQGQSSKEEGRIAPT